MADLPCIEHFQFPLIHCSIPARCNPSFAAWSKAFEEWASSDQGMIDAQPALFHCLCAPEAIDEEKSMLVIRHFGVLYSMDDQVGEPMKGDTAKLMRVFSGQEPVAAMASYMETMGELQERMPPGLYARFTDSKRYYSNRYSDALAFGTLQLFEFSLLDKDLPTSEIQMPEFASFSKAIGIHAALVNDLFSLRKEYYSGTWENNILFVLLKELRDFQKAVDRLSYMIQDAEKEALILQNKLLKRRTSADFRKLVHNLPYVMSGNLKYSACAPRYNGSNNTLLTGEVYHGTLLMHKHATIVLPPKQAAGPMPKPWTPSVLAIGSRPLLPVFM